MPPAPLPTDEAARLAALKSLDILDSAANAEFDAIVRAASLVCGTPISLISLVDSDRQWFKANIGLPGTAETPRDMSFCAHALHGDGLLEVADATTDPRFADNALVTGAPDIRFYAGMPLRLAGGYRVGTLCVIDRQPRLLDDTQREVLRQLACAAAGALDNWAARYRLDQVRAAHAADRDRLSNLVDGTGVATWEWNPSTGALRMNDRWASLIGRVPADLQALRDSYHPDDLARSDAAMARHLAGQGGRFHAEARFRHSDGRWVWIESHGAVMVRADDGAPEWVFGWSSDIHSRKLQEEALRTSERMLEETGRVAGVGGWVIELATGELTWTAAAFAIAGLPPGRQPTLDQAIGFYAPEARQLLIDARARAVAGGGPYDLEIPFIRADGQRIWVRSTGSAIHENGRAVRLVGAFQDVTARVQQGMALQNDANDRAQLAADAAGIGIWEWDIVADRMAWDRWMCRHYGVEPTAEPDTFAQWTGRLHPADRKAAEHAVREAIAGRRPLDTEFRVVHADGTVRTLRAAAKVVRDAAGAAVRMIGTNIDVTAPRRLAADLARQHEMLRVTLQSIGDAVITTDAAGRVAWLNPVAERLTGWAPADAVGRPLPDVFQIIDEVTREPQRDLVTACLEAGKVVGLQGSILLVSRYGDELAVEDSVAPIRNDQGEILGVVAVFRDVSRQRLVDLERGERERQLQAANAELDRLARHMAIARNSAEQASRAKTRFLAAMSHELRTPLNGILGYAQLLRLDGGLSVTQSERVQAMLSAGTHLLGMISAVLDLSEIETEGGELHTAAVDLASLLETSLNIVRPSAENKGLTLRLMLGAGVPQRVVTDPARLRQVLLNLLGNAVKYTDTGSVELRLHADPAHARLRFEVADTGPGIPAGEQHQLFQEFHRLESAASGTIEGAGLGLSLASRLASLLGGSLGYSDNPGGGSVFWLEVPLADDCEAAPPAANASDFVRAHQGTLAPNPHRARVLVVDDVAMNRDIAESFIRSAGYQVTCADGGAAAVETAAAADFLVVLMDVRMPGIDGLEATRRIRALAGPRAQVPIVALTAQVFTEQIDACREAGMDTHLAKPFTLETLLGAIERGVAAAHERRPPDGHTPSAASPAGSPPPPAAAGVGLALPAALAMGASLAVIDEAALGRTVAMLKPEAVDSYLRNIGDRAEALRRRLAARADLVPAAHSLAEAAHALAGSAGMFGFERLVCVARHFERAIKTDTALAAVLADDFDAALEVTLAALRRRTEKAQLAQPA